MKAVPDDIEPKYELLDVEISESDKWLIKFGFKEDPRIPEEFRKPLID